MAESLFNENRNPSSSFIDIRETATDALNIIIKANCKAPTHEGWEADIYRKAVALILETINESGSTISPRWTADTIAVVYGTPLEIA